MILQFVTFYHRIDPNSPRVPIIHLLGIFLLVLTLIIIAVWMCKDDNPDDN